MSALTACGNKKVYYKEKDAKLAMQEAVVRLQRRMYYYRCEYCGFFHLSRFPYKTKRRVIRSAGIVFQA